jgi:NTP pyrophosphatase (non-canonical NTP hydrolase)
MNSDLQKILKFRDARDWKQFHSQKNLAVSLTIEAGEVLEILQWHESIPDDEREHFAEELADVYTYLLLLAHDTGIDLSKALANKMTKNEKNYPVDKSKGKSTKYTKL